MNSSHVRGKKHKKRTKLGILDGLIDGTTDGICDGEILCKQRQKEFETKDRSAKEIVGENDYWKKHTGRTEGTSLGLLLGVDVGPPLAFIVGTLLGLSLGITLGI